MIHNKDYFTPESNMPSLNIEGFGFHDEFFLLYDLMELSLLGEYFFNGEYKKMLKEIKSRDSLKNLAQNTSGAYLIIKLPFDIKGESKYIKLKFYNDNLIKALKHMIKIKENNLLTYMKQQPSIIYGIHKEDDDFVDEFENYRIVFDETEGINFFDLLPIIRIKSLRDKMNDKDLYHLPLFVDNLDRNINIPPRFAEYMNNTHKFIKFRSVVNTDFGFQLQYNIEIGSILKDSNLRLEGITHDSDNTFFYILKKILKHLKEIDDVLNNFVDLLLVMSINQINYTRHIAEESIAKGDNRQLNFLNWYYYIEVDRQIEKVTKTPSHFFYKLYYGNFFTLDLVDKKVINVIYPFYVEVMLLILDEIFGYDSKISFDENMKGYNTASFKYKNTLKRIDYVKLIYFFEKIVKKDKEKKNEEFPYNHFRENNPDLRKKFEAFAKIKLKEKNIEFLIEFKNDDDDKPESKLRLISGSESESESESE